jgi:hypothetical protein
VILLLGELSALYPTAFWAATVNVYEVPVVSPDTVIGEDAPVAVCPPLLVTLYPVIGAPPLFPGAVKVTDA